MASPARGGTDTSDNRYGRGVLGAVVVGDCWPGPIGPGPGHLAVAVMVVTAMAAVVAAQAPADEETRRRSPCGADGSADEESKTTGPHPLDGAVVVLDADDLDPDVGRCPPWAGAQRRYGTCWLAER